MQKDYRYLIKLSNELSCDDMLFLMNCFQERIFVAYSKAGVTVCADLDKERPLCMNGTSIQVNILEDTKDELGN